MKARNTQRRVFVVFREVPLLGYSLSATILEAASVETNRVDTFDCLYPDFHFP
jgi:hypothetical protein